MIVCKALRMVPGKELALFRYITIIIATDKIVSFTIVKKLTQTLSE